MEIHKLKLFVRVVELKSFTRAGEVMLLAQPTVSEHIRNLEEELNQKLLNRLGREVEPTQAGLILYDYARKIIQTHREALEAVEKYSGRLTGRILMGCSTIPGTYIMPELINNFCNTHPTIKMTLRIASTRIIAQQVMRGELGLGVVGAKGNESGLQWTKVFDDELVVAVRPDHPWAQKGSIALKEITAEPFILREAESGTRRVVAGFLRANGLKESDLQEVAEIGSTAAIKEAVKRGIGISILSKRTIKDNIKFGIMAGVTIKGHRMQRPFYLIHHKSKALSPVATAFRDYLLQRAGKDRIT